MRDKVTMQDIADVAGVSKFAVSRALSGKSGVSAETREMILRIAGQLGYFKQEDRRGAQQLRDHEELKVSGTILVVFPNIRYQNQESVYWGPVFDGIAKRLNEKGMDILTLTEPSGEGVFSLLNPDAIQGIITVGTVSTTILLDIQRKGIPLVMVDHQDPAVFCDTIFTDNVNCMRQLTTKLISKGYRDYQFVGNIHDAHSYYERWLSFRMTLEQFEIPLKQRPALIGPEADHIHKVIAEVPEDELPEVFVCVNDTVAQFTIETLERQGIVVPERCAVTGFDNTAENLPILATVDVNKELLGMRAVDQMLWRIVNRDTSCERRLIWGDVIMRDHHAAKFA